MIEINNYEELDSYLEEVSRSEALRCKVTFNNNGKDFSAKTMAEYFLERLDCNVGSTQRGAPRAIYFYDCYVSKWRNLSQEDIDEMHGRLTSENYRNGRVQYHPSPRGIEYLSGHNHK